jgi:hypothetical protein
LESAVEDFWSKFSLFLESSQPIDYCLINLSLREPTGHLPQALGRLWIYPNPSHWSDTLFSFCFDLRAVSENYTDELW